MPAASFVTTVGSTSDVRSSKTDVVIVHEPETGAQLRTKGRLFLICEVGPGRGDAGYAIAREVAELAKTEYYYDLSAGIEVSLRRALRQADRRAAQKLKDQRGVTLHLACAVVVNNEIYGARIGRAQVFLVRRARLFLHGDEPGELADFVHRTTTREAASLGADGDVVPKVWRQTVEPGDTLIIASGALLEGLGAETLRSAAVTLHPRAAADHVHNRAVADGVVGSDAALFVELAQSSGAAQRVAPEPTVVAAPSEVVIADSIRSRIDAIWRLRPRLGSLFKGAARPVSHAASTGVAIGLELMPRRATQLPRRSENARERSRRQRRAITTLALLLIIVAGSVGALAYRDYQQNSAQREYDLNIATATDALASAHRLADRKPPDPDGARLKIAQTIAKLDEAERSPHAKAAEINAMRADATALTDRLDGVIVDLAKVAPGAKLAQVIGNVNGLYVADPGSGRLWRVWGDPLQQGPVMQKGTKGVGSPSLVTWDGEVIYGVDDARKVWRAEGDGLKDVTPADSATWKSVTSVAVFTQNLYVLDGATGQLWKHESSDGASFGKATAYLATPVPATTALSLAIDGDVWIVTNTSDVMRFRRNPLVTTAGRVDFTPRWQGEPLHPNAIQAVSGQANIYLMDAVGHAIVQMSRDGRELLRIKIPSTLPAASGFYVSELSRVAYTVHGSKVVATSLDQ